MSEFPGSSKVQDDSTSGDTQKAPVATIATFGNKNRAGRTDHWGLRNLLSRGTHSSPNRSNSNSIPSALSSQNNALLEQPILQRRVKMLACSQKQTLALLVGGELYTWGGDPNNILMGSNSHTPPIRAQDGNILFPRRLRIAFDSTKQIEVVFIAAGHDHFAALTIETKNNLYTWGENTSGQLGHGDRKGQKTPRKIILWKKRKSGTRDYGDTLSHYLTDDDSDLRIVHVACSYKFTLAVSDNNRMFGWGKNKSGQLGLSCAVTGGSYSGTAESAKRQAAFQEAIVLRPVELSEMCQLGYNVDATVNDEDQIKLAQLMISVGTQHATSWIHTEKFNKFSESYQVEHRRLKKRVEQLETEVLKYQVLLPGSSSNDQPGARAEAGSSTTTTGIAVTPESIANIPRRVTDDPTLNATGKLLAELHNGLLASQAELLATKQEVQDSAGTESEQKKALTQQEINVKNLWKMVEILDYDRQILESSLQKKLKEEKQVQQQAKDGKKKKEKGKSLAVLKLSQLIDAKTREANDKKTLALNGRAKLTDEHKRLTSLGEENTRLREKFEKINRQRQAMEDKVVLLNKLYVGHDKLIRRTYINHNKQDVFDLAATARSLFHKIRISDVAGLAANANLVERMTRDLGHQPGVDDLICESNRRLVETMMEAEDCLDRKIGVTDARRELADLLKEALHDMTVLRRQNNTYVAGILSRASTVGKSRN